jgi:hypothetical protein
VQDHAGIQDMRVEKQTVIFGEVPGEQNLSKSSTTGHHADNQLKSVVPSTNRDTTPEP